MSKSLSRIAALEEISNWSTNDVLSILRKNGLEDCCKAVQKRQVDGDEFLHLTEGKLALWKSDLTRPLTWNLWRFVEELKKSPEKYVAEKSSSDQQSEDAMSDSGSWGTDFEDDVDEEDGQPDVQRVVGSINGVSAPRLGQLDVSSRNTEFRNSLMLFRENERASREHDNCRANEKLSGATRNETIESTYSNCETDVDSPEDGSTYANCTKAETLVGAPKNVSNLHAKFEKSLAEQLKEQLRLRNARKPTIGPKPEVPRTAIFPRTQPQKSFLHALGDVVPALQQQQQQQIVSEKTISIPAPEVERAKSIDKPETDLPRPPVMLRNFDLVANLPMRTEESEDEYETFDEQIIEQNQRLSIARVDSKQSLSSARQSSSESIYKTPSTTSQDKQEEEYEIYESITETPEDNGYYPQPIEREKPVDKAPPPLPAKPAGSPISPSPTPTRSIQEKNNERSPDKKSATLPHSGSGTSLSAESRATRPLPPPPDKQSYMDSPWFHNVTREQATTLIKDRAYGSGQNGYFLLRPSTSHPNNPLALVLWFKDRVYNVPVRKRPDNRFLSHRKVFTIVSETHHCPDCTANTILRYALGSAKVNEQSFASVDEIVKFYSREELVLHTGGVQTGSTKLTDTPPK